MFDKLRRILEKADADYADSRYEINDETIIHLKGKELKTIGSNSTDGYVIRVLKDGGMSSIPFTREIDAESALHKAIQNAKLFANNTNRPIRLAKAEVVKDTFFPELKEDPRKISILEKLELMRNYNSIPLGYDKIATTDTYYQEVTREKYFVSTEGTEIKESLITTKLFISIVSKEGNHTQYVWTAAGGSNGFSKIRNQEENIEKRTSIALDLLKATPISGGAYNCIINPAITGTFIHEAFGHFSEADSIQNLPAVREKMKFGNKLGSDVLNIIDDATMPSQLGFYKYDDEGVRTRPTQLMKNGVLTGRLHSRRTAADFGEHISGHFVAQDYRFAPIIRMGNIFIEPYDKSFNELLSILGNGLYVVDQYGGETHGENFTFGAQYGYRIKNGKLAEMVRDINISGSLYETLGNITTVADDLAFSELGGCGKGDQKNIRSSMGGPHILVNNLVVGGR